MYDFFHIFYGIKVELLIIVFEISDSICIDIYRYIHISIYIQINSVQHLSVDGDVE